MLKKSEHRKKKLDEKQQRFVATVDQIFLPSSLSLSLFFNLFISICCVLSSFEICCLPVLLLLALSFCFISFFFQFICRSENIFACHTICKYSHRQSQYHARVLFWSGCLLYHCQSGPEDNSSSSHLRATASLKITLGFSCNFFSSFFAPFILVAQCTLLIHLWTAATTTRKMVAAASVFWLHIW